jgi:ABC-2 type transport system ATP-binding protein
MPEVIRARALEKTFRTPVPVDPGAGPLSRLAHLIRNPSQPFTAVRDLDLDVGEGETLGFLGANGSGKSTTIKMLTGILTPSAGEVEVLGHVPHRRRAAFTSQIGLVLGQKSLLWWNIPVIESFKLYRDIYSISSADFETRLKLFSEVLELTKIMHVPVRKLSLGLRMRAEIAASLLHRPRIIFLDEPTIGLDVRARLKLKRFLRRVNEETGVTIFLTTHNMFDVEDVCSRCVIISKGSSVFDGDVATLRANEQHKRLELEIFRTVDEARLERALSRCEVITRKGPRVKLQVPSDEAVEIIGELLESCRLANLNVVPPTLESIVERILERNEGDGGSDASQALEAAV